MATGSIEKLLESKFTKWVDSIGGKAVKGPAYMYMGIPDRIAVLPNGGGTVWVEFKGGTSYGLTPKQIEWKERLINSDPSRYFCIDTREQLKELQEYCLKLSKMLDNQNNK